MRQKARAKAGHEVKKQPHIVEYHHDDCGEDFSPLGDDSFFQDWLDSASDAEEESLSLPSWEFGLNGSDFEPSSPAEHGIGSQQLVFDDLESFNAWNEGNHGLSGGSPPAYRDVAEICGGAADTGSLLIRRGYVGGPNFDIIVGYDLKKDHMARGLLQYLK